MKIYSHLLFLIFFVFLTKSLLSSDFGLKSDFKEEANPELLKESIEKNGKFGFIVAKKETMPKLYNIVERLCKKLNNPIPEILVFKGNLFFEIFNQLGQGDYKCNALALSLSKKTSLICIGYDLIENLSEAELEAVIAHELGHIDKYHVLKKAILIILITIFFDKIIKKIISKKIIDKRFKIDIYSFVYDTYNKDISIGLKKEGDFIYYFLIFKLAKKILTQTISRKFECEADEMAAKIIDNPENLVQALYKIKHISNEKPRFIDFFNNLFLTHPENKLRKKALLFKK